MLTRSELIELAKQNSTVTTGNMYTICQALNKKGIRTDNDGNVLDCEDYKKGTKTTDTKIKVKIESENVIDNLKDNLSKLNKKDLVIVAKKYKVKGAQAMNVADLRDAIYSYMTDKNLIEIEPISSSKRKKYDDDDDEEEEEELDDEDEDEEEDEEEDEDDEEEDEEEEDEEEDEDDYEDDEEYDDEEEDDDLKVTDLENFRIIKLLRILEDEKRYGELQMDKLRNLYEKIGIFLNRLP